jgi:hypothetical protein
MEARKLISEAHLIVQQFLESQGYSDALAAFLREATPVLEDIPKSMPAPRPLLETLTDIRMNQLHSQLGQLNMLRYNQSCNRYFTPIGIVCALILTLSTWF